jgi:hypothetical protein
VQELAQFNISDMTGADLERLLALPPEMPRRTPGQYWWSKKGFSSRRHDQPQALSIDPTDPESGRPFRPIHANRTALLD